MKKHSIRIVELRLLHFSDWRLLPWYDSGPCSHGCCIHREFTWLFFAIRVSYVTPPNQEKLNEQKLP
jgi:hypothetical protein